MQIIIREFKIIIFQIIIKIFTKIQFIKLDLIHNVYFSGLLNVPIKSNNIFIKTNEMFKYSLLTKRQLTGELYFKEKEKTKNKLEKNVNLYGNFLICPNSSNYIICLTFFLSIISLIKEIEEKKITLLIDKKIFRLYKKDIGSLFKLFNFKNYQLYNISQKNIYYFQKAFFLKKKSLILDKPNLNFLYHAKLGADLTKKKIKVLNTKKKTSIRNFFIPRNSAKRRVLVNQKEIKLFFKNYNIKTIDTENLKIEKKIAIFNKCQNLFITFGAAQATIFFLPDKIKIFGLFNEVIEDLWLRGLAIVKDAKLVVIRGKNLDPKDKSNNSDFYLSKLELKKELENMINSNN